MLEPILAGVTLGLVLAMLIGPVFFMLLNTSLKKGFKPAAYLAVGVMLSDAVYISIVYFGSKSIVLIQSNKAWIGIIGGVVLILFGIVTAIKKPVIQASSMELPDDSKTLLIDTGKGFMMNMLNPFVLLFWLGVAGTLTAKDHYTPALTFVFFTATLSTILGTDLLKAWLATRLKKIITPALLLWLNRISGLGLVLFGCKMLYNLFY
jgi:threonine/homoserine/homoserine lactone efflux protein